MLLLTLTESVEMRVMVSEIVTQVSLRLPGMFLLIHPCQWVTVAEDEMNFVYTSTFVWTKHNGVWCGIIKLTLKEQQTNTFSLRNDVDINCASVINCASDISNARTKCRLSE